MSDSVSAPRVATGNPYQKSRGSGPPDPTIPAAASAAMAATSASTALEAARTGRPNAVDRLIALKISRYPRTNSSRADALIHLFLRNGNGYFWKDGALVNGYEYTPRPIELSDVDGVVAAWEERGLPEVAAQEKQRLTANNRWIMDRVSRPDHHARPGEVYEESFVGGISASSALWKVPDNAKAEWREAALETIELVLKFAPNPDDKTEAARAREALLRRFPDLHVELSSAYRKGTKPR